jgi:hypothetical protein
MLTSSVGDQDARTGRLGEGRTGKGHIGIGIWIE